MTKNPLSIFILPIVNKISDQTGFAKEDSYESLKAVKPLEHLKITLIKILKPILCPQLAYCSQISPRALFIKIGILSPSYFLKAERGRFIMIFEFQSRPRKKQFYSFGI